MACSRENLLLRRLSLMGTQFLLQFMTFTMKQYESPRHRTKIVSQVESCVRTVKLTISHGLV